MLKSLSRRGMLAMPFVLSIAPKAGAEQLYPEQFQDVDPVQSQRAFHERYLPIAFEGTWMARLTG